MSSGGRNQSQLAVAREVRKLKRQETEVLNVSNPPWRRFIFWKRHCEEEVRRRGNLVCINGIIEVAGGKSESRSEKAKKPGDRRRKTEVGSGKRIMKAEGRKQKNAGNGQELHI